MIGDDMNGYVSCVWRKFERIYKGFLFKAINDAENNLDFAPSYIMPIINIFL